MAVPFIGSLLCIMNILNALRTPSIFSPDDLHVYRKAQLVNYSLIIGALLLFRAALNNLSYHDETTTLYAQVSVVIQFVWTGLILFAYGYFKLKRKIDFPAWVAALSAVWVVANLIHYQPNLAAPLTLLVPILVFPMVGLRWGALVYLVYSAFTLYVVISHHRADADATPIYLVNNYVNAIVLGGVVTWFLELGRYEVIDKLYKSATKDVLTLCWNRNMFQKSLDEELERAKRFKSAFTLVMFDIDFFKQINDSYGHDVGDQVLKEFAKRIESKIRSIDLFARWGGEEFVLLLTGVDSLDAHNKAEELLAAVRSHPFEHVGNLTCSAGIASYCPGAKAQELVKKADVALYRAKEAGRDQLVVSDYSGLGLGPVLF